MLAISWSAGSPVPEMPLLPAAVSVQSSAQLLPPLSLITVFFSVRFGASSSLTIVQTAESPGSSLMDATPFAITSPPFGTSVTQSHKSLLVEV